jgi:hypothetical protein
MKLIYEAWLSPKRKEVYFSNHLGVDTDVCVSDEPSYFTDPHYDSSVFELFNEDEQDGLWKVVCEATYQCHQDPHHGDWDCEFIVDKVHLKSKCSSLSELRQTWEVLQPSEDNKSWKCVKLKS